jgi:wyosine [tRNA(Phe)-imidazoG37] synthetase (radical SAM superfamily)
MRVFYGPIDSWRFGRSLGVDPLAGRAKMCPFSCIYCQYGPTLRPTGRRGTFVTVERLRAELESLGNVEAERVTFAGLGEPTLAQNLPALVAEVRRRLDLPILLLTGSALMPREEVRRDLLAFDQVAAKLDAPDERLYRQINRPMSGFPYPLAAIVAGIRQFRRMYTGRLILQMMVLQSNVHLAAEMAALARPIEADEIQLNTPLQPALGGPISAAEMKEVEGAFEGLPVHCVYDRDRARIRPRQI